MALFGKGDSFEGLCQQIKSYRYHGAEQLHELMNQLLSRPEATATRVVWGLSHADPKVRKHAADWLLKRNDKQVLDLLLREAVGKTAQIREEILGLLSRSTEPERLARWIGSMMSSARQDQRESAMGLLQVLPEWHKHLALVQEGLNDPSLSIRMQAVQLLCTRPTDPPIFLMLRGLTADPNKDLRRLAIRSLAENPNPEIVEAFFERLPKEDSETQKVIVDALSRLAKDPEMKFEERVIPLLADEDASVREAALRLLMQMPNRSRIIRAFLVHSRGIATWLRERTVQSLMKYATELSGALQELLEDPDEDVRVGAMSMCMTAKDESVVPHALKLFLGDSDWWVRSMAIEVLAAFPSRETIHALITKLDDPELRFAVVGALGEIKNPTVAGHLVRCLQENERCIRAAALDGLSGYEQKPVLLAILNCAKSDPEPAVREKAAVVLRRGSKASEPYVKELEESLTAQQRMKADLDECGALHEELELEMENPDL